jgi:hypothetical protein
LGPAPEAAAAAAAAAVEAAVGAAEVDYYFGGIWASDRTIAHIDSAVIEGDEEIDRGPHVDDDDE